ncbi:lysosomal acid phosphatase-like, partial [Lampetra planeri]
MFGGFKTHEKSRLQGGKLLGYVMGNLTASANGSSPLRLQLLSAHDTTVAALLSALGGLHGDASSLPPYAAAVLIELLAHSNGSHSVELWYRNSSLSAPLPISLPGCPQRCPLGDFSRLLLPIVPGDWRDECPRRGRARRCHRDPAANVTAGNVNVNINVNNINIINIVNIVNI